MKDRGRPGAKRSDTRPASPERRRSARRSSEPCRLVVMGASAGGVEALSRVIDKLPADFPAALFIVLHISPAGPSLLPEILNRVGPLPVTHARDGQTFKPGHIYVAPPDHHLVIKNRTMKVTRGPKENNARPAVDPLFRTAARHYGPWVIGVVLSGGLDDGTLGLMDVKRFGGIAVIQHPDEALFPSMPRSALDNVQVDHVVPLAQIGPLLVGLSREPVPAKEGAAFMSRKHRHEERDIAEIGTDDLKTHNMGPPSKFTCPECGGALWELENGKLLRYRCHIGHGYTAETLMDAQAVRLEDAMWTALRALEESAGMRRRMATRARKGGWNSMASSYEEQAQDAEDRAGLIRAVLVEEKPQKITATAARRLETQSADTVDPDAGKAQSRQPPAPVPPGPPSVPRQPIEDFSASGRGTNGSHESPIGSRQGKRGGRTRRS